MGFGLKILKIITVNLICVFAFNLTALADQELATLIPGRAYQNMMKSFLLRSSLGSNTFYQGSIKEFQEPMMKTLALIYMYSEFKSGKGVPQEFKEYFSVTNEKEILLELDRVFSKAKRVTFNNISQFGEVNAADLKMIFVVTQTISEFAPYLNVKDKLLRETLVEGFKELALSLAGHYLDTDLSKGDPSRPYLKPALYGIQEMNKALTPPTVLSKIISKFQTIQRPVVNQNGTVPSCSGFFH